MGILGRTEPGRTGDGAREDGLRGDDGARSTGPRSAGPMSSSQEHEEEDGTRINVVLNFHEEVRRLTGASN